MMLATTDAELFGRLVGQCVASLLLLWGVTKCWSISRRETTNTKCAVSLMLILISFALSSLMTIFLRGGSGGRIVAVLIGLVIFVLMVVAGVLAILGLLEYKRAGGRYVQGKAQAIWALILCAFFLTLGVQGFMRGRSGVTLMKQPPPGTPLVFEDLNFKFTAPGRPWSQTDFSKVNPYAKLAFLRGNPEVYFLISAEQAAGSELNADAFADLATARTKGMADSMRVLRRTPVQSAGMDWLEVEVEAVLRGNRLHYLNWFGVTNGWAFQMVAWGREDLRTAVVAEGKKLMQNFEVLDYQRQPPLTGPGIGADYVSPDFHFRVKCGTPEWLEWTRLDTDCEPASFGVMHRNDAALVVSAVWLMNQAPKPFAIYRAMLELFGAKEPSGIIAGASAIKESGLDGIEAAFELPMANGNPLRYRMKILHGDGHAYLVAAWIEATKPDTGQWLSNAVGLVEITRPRGAVADPTRWDERTKRVHRLTLNALGRQPFNDGGFVEAARYFELATSLGGPAAKSPYLGNLCEALVSAGKYDEALQALERYPVIVAAQPNLQAQRGFLLGRLGQPGAAITNYSELFAAGYSAEDHFREYIGLLVQNNRSDRAGEEVEKFLKRQDTPGIRLMEASLLKQGRKYDEAIAILKRQREKSPFNSSVAYSLGDAQILAGQPTETLKLAGEMISQQGNSAAMWLLKGRAEFALKWYRDAKESFTKAQKEAPTDADVKSYLEAVSAILGEGVNAMVKDAIAPVPLAAGMDFAPATPPVEYGRDEGAYYQQLIKAIAFARGRELKVTDYLKIKTLTPTGVAAFSTFQIGFSPLAEELYVNRLEVRDPGGSLVSTGRVSDYFVLDDRSSSAAVSRKILNLPVSGLQPGCTVELIYTRRELGEIKEFTYLSHAFSRAAPVQESVVYLTGETGAVRFASSPALVPQAFADGLCWRQSNPPVVRWEPLMPQLVDYVPILWIGDAQANWSGLASNYVYTIRDRLELPPSQQALARTLTGGMTNVEDRIAAIATYVQTNYGYKAIEFGRRARVPQPLAETVHNKYGDCKDHSVLVQQMLRAAGVPASLALVSVGAPGRRDLPTLDQFDHMLVYISGTNTDRFLDCTVKGSDLGVQWTPGLAGRDALVLESDNPRFIRIPSYPTNASVIRATRSIELTNGTDAMVREELVFRGLHAGFMRDYLRNLLPEGRRAYFAGQIIGTAGQLQDLTFEGLEQPRSALAVRMSYLAREQFHTLGNQLSGNPTVAFERAFLLHEAAAKRVTPFEVSIPLTVEGSVTIGIPPGFKPLALDSPSAKRSGEYVSCWTRTQVVANGWRIDYQLYQPAIQGPASAYGDYFKATQEAVELLKPRLTGERIPN